MLRGAWRWGLAAAVFAATPAYSQTASGLPSREELNPADRARPPEPAPDLFHAPPPGPCPFAASDLTIPLKGVHITGLTGASIDTVRGAWAAQTGTAIKLGELCAIRDRVAERLFRAGLLVRVEIPEQKIVDGTPTLEVIEASVAGVSVRGDAGPATRIIEDYAERLRGMTPFSLKKAQRYLLLAAEVPGITLRTIVRPSITGARGAVDLELVVDRDPVRAVANIQNYQSRVAGRIGALARVDFNSLTELGDRTSIVFYRTVESNEQFVGQLLEELRLGGSGLMLRGSLAYGETRPGDVLKPLNLRSVSTVANLELAYPLVKTRAQSLTLAGGFDAIVQRSEVRGGGGRILNDQLRIVYARAEGELRPWLGQRQAVFGAGIALRKGIDGLGATPAGSFLSSRIDGRADAFVTRFNAHALVPAGRYLTLSARGEAQASSKPLLAYEELPIGNLSIGRGYDPASAAGDRGVAGSFEARLGPFDLGSGLFVAPYGFYDAARVTNRDASAPGSKSLTSAGGGVQLRLGSSALLDVAYAKGFDAVQTGGGKPKGRLLVNLTVSVD